VPDWFIGVISPRCIDATSVQYAVSVIEPIYAPEESSVQQLVSTSTGIDGVCLSRPLQCTLSMHVAAALLFSAPALESVIYVEAHILELQMA
jgi:hypothetical protein